MLMMISELFDNNDHIIQNQLDMHRDILNESSTMWREREMGVGNSWPPYIARFFFH